MPPNRIPEYEIRSWMHFFLSLPPLTRLGSAHDLGYETEHCLTHPDDHWTHTPTLAAPPPRLD